jgi:inner membrane transporter RhtA
MPATGWAGTAERTPAWSLAVVAMLSVQLGGALSVGLFPVLGPAGTAWLRLVAGAVILLAIARPRRCDVPSTALVPVGLLGLATATMAVSFLVAIDRIPLGTTVAIEFLGPLTVAAMRAHERRMLAWPALALLGVLMLTKPWEGQADGLGLIAAALGAIAWGGYILLTQHVGDQVAGVKGLALTIPIAAIVAAPFGAPQAVGALSLPVLLAIIGLAVLLPVLPFSLEMLALRRLTATAFGTLMALEPGFAVVIGAVVLHQVPTLLQICGVALVILAGMGAERGGHRHDHAHGPEQVAATATS